MSFQTHEETFQESAGNDASLFTEFGGQQTYLVVYFTYLRVRFHEIITCIIKWEVINDKLLNDVVCVKPKIVSYVYMNLKTHFYVGKLLIVNMGIN